MKRWLVGHGFSELRYVLSLEVTTIIHGTARNNGDNEAHCTCSYSLVNFCLLLKLRTVASLATFVVSTESHGQMLEFPSLHRQIQWVCGWGLLLLLEETCKEELVSVNASK